jgi:hypothetical protein
MINTVPKFSGESPHENPANQSASRDSPEKEVYGFSSRCPIPFHLIDSPSSILLLHDSQRVQ